MSEETTGEHPFDEEDVGSTLYDVKGGEIGTIEDYDDDHVYVEPSDDFDDDETLDALGWRAPDGSFEITTDAVRGLPDDVEGDHGVDLSAYERPDDEADSGNASE